MKFKIHSDTIIYLEHDNREFFIIKDAYYNDEEYIGFYIYYQDGKRYRNKVIRKSLYGEHITKTINAMSKMHRKELEEEAV